MENIQGETLVPNLVDSVDADSMAIGIFLEQMPNVDTLKQIKHLLEVGNIVSTPERMVLPVYFTVEGQAVQQIGHMHLSIDKHLRLDRLLKRFGLDLCYVINGVRGTAIPRDTLVHTIKLSDKSIYDYI